MRANRNGDCAGFIRLRRKAGSAASAGFRRRVGDCAGFTLLEVLIAIMIFAMGITAILPLFAVGSSSHRRGIDQTQGALMAARIAAELQQNMYSANPQPIQNAVFKDVDKIYRYDAEFTPLDPLDPMKLAFIVKVKVKFGPEEDGPSDTFETVLLRKFRR